MGPTGGLGDLQNRNSLARDENRTMISRPSSLQRSYSTDCAIPEFFPVQCSIFCSGNSIFLKHFYVFLPFQFLALCRFLRFCCCCCCGGGGGGGVSDGGYGGGGGGGGGGGEPFIKPNKDCIRCCLFFPWSNSPQWARASSLSRIHDYTQDTTRSVGFLWTSGQPDAKTTT